MYATILVQKGDSLCELTWLYCTRCERALHWLIRISCSQQKVLCLAQTKDFSVWHFIFTGSA